MSQSNTPGTGAGEAHSASIEAGNAKNVAPEHVEDLLSRLRGWKAVAGLAIVTMFGGSGGFVAYWKSKYPYEDLEQRYGDLKNQLATQKNDHDSEMLDLKAAHQQALTEAKEATKKARDEVEEKNALYMETALKFYQLKGACGAGAGSTITINGPCSAAAGGEANCKTVSTGGGGD